jgi:hypothetical protein
VIGEGAYGGGKLWLQSIGSSAERRIEIFRASKCLNLGLRNLSYVLAAIISRCTSFWQVGGVV